MFKGRSFLVKMVKDDETGVEEEVNVGDEIKSHFERNKAAYISGIMFVGFAFLMTKSSSSHIDREISVTAKNGVAVNGNKVMLSNVTVIAANRQGPPSWVIHNKTTGDFAPSQRAMAIHDGISESNLSQHLNGIQDSVSGMKYERVCMAA